MVVTLDTQRNRYAIANIDHASVFTWANQHVVGFGGQAFEVNARRFVRAVLGPHDRIHGQLDMVGVSAQDLDDPREFVVSEAKFSMEGIGHARHVSAAEPVGGAPVLHLHPGPRETRIYVQA
jgi:hypothetical protein